MSKIWCSNLKQYKGKVVFFSVFTFQTVVQKIPLHFITSHRIVRKCTQVGLLIPGLTNTGSCCLYEGAPPPARKQCFHFMFSKSGIRSTVTAMGTHKGIVCGHFITMETDRIQIPFTTLHITQHTHPTILPHFSIHPGSQSLVLTWLTKHNLVHKNLVLLSSRSSSFLLCLCLFYCSSALVLENGTTLQNA